MRLKALRSMKEKLDQEDDEMVDEMEELLHEADQAANDDGRENSELLA